VATRKENPFGLFDMHGNVSEWVHDGWTPDTYQDFPAGDVRIFRGGNFRVAPVECRSANRYAGVNGTWWIHTGFRVAISVEGALNAGGYMFCLSLVCERSSFVMIPTVSRF
jgi:formylglycine-generating enzyme required for sulfatase activity